MWIDHVTVVTLAMTKRNAATDAKADWRGAASRLADKTGSLATIPNDPTPRISEYRVGQETDDFVPKYIDARLHS